MTQYARQAPDVRTRLALLFVLVLATVLRLYHIDFHGIWPDELASLRYATDSLDAIVFGPNFDYHPPLYYLFLHFWIDLFSATEFSIRLPSVFFGILSVLMTYVLGSRLYGPFVGLVAAVIISLSPWHLVYSHLARMYTPLLFFSLCSTYFLFRIMEKPSRFDAIAYLITTVLALYTQNMAVFMVVGQNIYYLSRWVASRRTDGLSISFLKWCLIQAAIVAIYSPWIMVTLFAKLSEMQGNYWVDREPLYQYLGGVVFIFAGIKKHTAVFLLAPWLCLLALLGTVHVRRFLRPAHAEGAPPPIFRLPRQSGLLWALLVVPPVLTAIASQYMQPFFVPRSFIASSVALYILAAVGISTFKGRGRMIVLAVTLVAAAAVLLQSYLQKFEQGFRQPLLAVMADATPDDTILIDKNSGAYYSLQLTDRDDVRIRDLPAISAREPLIITGHCLSGSDRRIWLVRSKPVPDTAAALFETGGLVLAETRNFGMVTVDMFACGREQ